MITAIIIIVIINNNDNNNNSNNKNNNNNDDNNFCSKNWYIPFKHYYMFENYLLVSAVFLIDSSISPLL